MTPAEASLELTADAAGLARLDDWIEAVASNWSPAGVMKARLCAAELANNVMEHGGLGAAARITLRLAPDTDGVLIELIDDGAAFSPVRASPEDPGGELATASESGWGLRTVHAIAAWMQYRREGERNHTRLLVPYG